MRTRPVSLLPLLLLFALSYFAAGDLLAAAQTPEPAEGAELTPTPTTAPSPTPTPATAWGRFVASAGKTGEDFGTLEKAVTTPALALARLFLAGLVIYLALLLFRRLRGLIPRPVELVAEPLSNLSGYPSLDPAMEGLNQLFRQKLLKELEDARYQVKNSIAKVGPEEFSPSKTNPLPFDTPTGSLDQLIASLDAAAPEQVKPFVQVMGAVFPPRGSRITAKLLRKPDSTGKLGIAVQISDLEGQQERTGETFWEVSAPKLPIPTGATPLPPLPQPPSSPYLEIGKGLIRLGRFGEAISYLEEALKCEPESVLAREALKLAVERGQAQSRAALAYAAGKQLAAAGLPRLAVENYLQALPKEEWEAARPDWERALELVEGDSGASYRRLAHRYRQEREGLAEKNAYLCDEALALLDLAVEKGSKTAAREREALKRASARQLYRVGRTLLGLEQFSAAEKYLGIAVERQPEHPEARAALETAKGRQVPVGDVEAEAAYRLALLYESQGDLEGARAQYEAALKKTPDREAISLALERTLHSRQQLTERYNQLMDRAARWLAIQLFQREMEAATPPEDNGRYAGKVYNFTGAMYHSSRSGEMRGDDLFDLAEIEYQRAIDVFPYWYQPYKNLADLYHKIGNKRDNGGKIEYQRLAVFNHQEALDRADAISSKKDRKLVEGHIRIGKATDLLTMAQAMQAMLDSGTFNPKMCQTDPALLSRKRKEIESLYQDAQNLIDCVNKELAPEDVTDHNYIHDLANWYALAHKFKPKAGLEKHARRYVAYRLARDRTLVYWRRISRDPDFQDLLCGYDRLKLHLTQALLKQPNLCKQVGQGFRKAMDHIFLEAEWV